ncbi:glutathione peroxidase [Pseudobacillus badius]|uniref:glutathione peroxidase n=1 Tax=Bacillus badius TaxID=1455 RepID=UPI0007B0A7B9|nr:glutathione peroxidase [Bacillus badius]KZN99424.1 glutathione peroxidase [Bacillus badius]MED0668570.1 glutathione peroxidase [Bacillus badius]OCS85169.1 glutathione peroxidase [Bacillus badius]OVE46621.1 glutathione peroxidase [Bacillus badius]TDV98328.1 glutathione peroxidase [Bacillus badius]
METIYDIEVTNSQGEPVSIADFQGQVLLIVNTASKCGFTPQFKELQSLYEKYKEQGFTILGFPSDEFMNQEFEEQEKIIEFCQLNYGVTFPMFQKMHVKGKNIHPLFRYLTAQQSGLLTGTIKWNFTKFLVSREGEVVQRYAPKTSPLKIEKDLQELL